MFSEMFKALKRIVDATVAPLLMSMLLLAVEWGLGALSWAMVTVADLVFRLLATVIAIIPIPEGLELDVSTFGQKFLDIAEVAGVWPAMGVFVAGVGVRFLVKVITLGIGTN